MDKQAKSTSTKPNEPTSSTDMPIKTKTTNADDIPLFPGLHYFFSNRISLVTNWGKDGYIILKKELRKTPVHRTKNRDTS